MLTTIFSILAGMFLGWGIGANDSGNLFGAAVYSRMVRYRTATILIAVFVIFVLIVSDVFTNNIVTGFRGAVRCRTPTSYGVVVQGIFLVIFYVLALYMIESGII